MGRDRDEVLGRLAEAITDETPVDWAAEASTDPGLSGSLDTLRLIERIAGVYRDPWSTAAGSEDALFAWGHLRVVEKLGEGGWGTVYRAHDPHLQRDVALKLLRADRAVRAADRLHFIEEARRMARVRHPNVLSIHGAEEHDGRVGFWSDLVRGETIEDRLRRDGPLGGGETVAMGLELCRALAAVHVAGIVHGDVKASNVMRDEKGRIVLADFGAGSEATSEGTSSPRFGTPLALAPEILEGKAAGPASDIYALSVLLFRLLTGRYPVEAPDVAALRAKHQRGERNAIVDLRPDLSPVLSRAIERGLSAEPGARFRSAGEMESALAAALQETPVHAGAPVSAATDAPRLRSRRMGIALVSCAVLLAAAGLAWQQRGKTGTTAGERGGDMRSTPAASGPLTALAERGPARPASPATATSGPRTAQGASATTGLMASAQVGSTPGSPAPIMSALEVEATLFRSRGGAREALPAGALVRPGDALFLEVEGSSDLVAYVLNEDEAGQVYLLYPLPGLDSANPLAGQTRHRLPGTRGGVPQDWQVTSGRGTESFLVVAARRPLPSLEEMTRGLVPARPNQPVVPAPLDPRALSGERGVGGMVPADPSVPGAAGSALSRVARQLAAEADEPGGLWIRELTVYNLGR